MKVFLTLLLILSYSTLTQAQRLPDTVLPEHYQVQLNPSIAAATYTGDETIAVRLLKPATEITLNAIEINFKEVTIAAGGKTQAATVSLNPKTETATLKLPQQIPAGPAVIHITFDAVLNDQLRGFYLSKGKTRNYATTQMEPTDARRAFPCFDEPAMKATFDVATTIDKGDIAFSNGKIISDVPGPGEDKHTVTFSTTPKMSSYLVALVVGDFQCLEGSSDGIPIRVCATPDKTDLVKAALPMAEHILHYFDQYYSIKYPYKKLDVLAVPDFSAGAMENTGAITYRETLLFINERTASQEDYKYVADVLAHEMAHQWFGDLVTMKWWNDVWLNEGFATWMSPKPVRDWHPDWNNRINEAEHDENAKTKDSLKTTPAIRSPAQDPNQIGEMFDSSIAYNKTAAILRMVENYVGPETFRAGVNQYLEKHAYGNATSEDFWNTLAATSRKPVDRIMASFVQQPGVPLVTVASSCKNNKTEVTVSQRRFFDDRSSFEAGAKEKWEIPVCVRNAQGKYCQVLKEKTQAFSLAGCSSWLFANVDSGSYYRTEYGAENLHALAAIMENDLTPEERLSLVSDQWALVRAGQSTVADYLAVVQGLKEDRGRAIWAAVGGQLRYIHAFLLTASDRPQYEAWVRDLLAPAINELSLNPQSGDTADTKAVRAEIADTLANAGNDPAVIRQLTDLVPQIMKDASAVNPYLVPVAVAAAARHGDAALYQQYRDKLKSAQTPDEYYLYLYSLPGFPQPELVKQNLDFVLTPELRNQDATGFMQTLLATPTSGPQAWDFLRTNWTTLQSKLSSYTKDEVVAALAAFCDANLRDDIKGFFATHKTAAEHTLGQSLERVNACIDLRAEQSEPLAQWLNSSSGSIGLNAVH
jgi:aminopeptidase N/puromycin-sensitive aminopeptidase